MTGRRNINGLRHRWGVPIGHQPVQRVAAALAMLLAVAVTSGVVSAEESGHGDKDGGGKDWPFRVRLLGRLAGCSGRGICFSQDGSRVLTVGDDGARVWNAETSKPVAEPVRWDGPRGHCGAALSPDGGRVVTFRGAAARIRDVAGAAEDRRLKHDGRIWSAAFSPDGSKVVTAGEDGTTAIWDVVSGKQVVSKRYGDPARLALFSPDGGKVLSIVVANAAEAFPKGTAYVWSAETGRQVSSHQVDYSMTATSNRYAAAFTPDGNRVATIDYTDVSVWDVASGKAISTTRAGEFAGPSGLAFSPDGEKLVGVGGAGVADVWANKREATWVRQLPSDWLGGRAPRTGRVEGACFVDGSRWVLLAANFGATGVYDLETGRRTWDITTQGVAGQKSDEVPAIAVSGDGRRLAAGLASTDETTVWSLEPPPGRLKRAQ